MIQQDYIMRMIKQLADALARILLNKEKGNYQEAINDVEYALENIIGLDYNLLNSLSSIGIISLLKISGDDTIVRMKCIVIAKLLKEIAELKKLINEENSSAIYDYQKSLNLYLEGILNNKNNDIELNNYYLDIKEIVAKIEMSQDVRFRLFKFYELIGVYDKAEDELFRLKDLGCPNIEDEGIKFYRNLEKLSNKDLMKGNLSKKEIVQGLEQLTKGKI